MEDEIASEILNTLDKFQGECDTDVMLMALGKVIMGVAEAAHKQRNEDNLYLRN